MSLRTLAVIAVIVAVFYLARQILLPIAIAVLLSFVLAPLANRLERLGVGRVGAVIITVALVFLLVALLIFAVGQQAVDFTGELPKYEKNLSRRVHSLKGATGSLFGKAAETVVKIEEELSGSETAQSGDSPQKESPTQNLLLGNDPIAVKVVNDSPLLVRVAKNWLGTILSPLGWSALVFVLVVFILLYRDDLGDRVIRLAGNTHIYATNQVLIDAGHRVSSYLLMQLCINSAHATVVALGLWMIGLPNAFLWGLLAGVLRFVPYLGPWMGALGPILLSLAVFEGWFSPLLTAGMFVTLELIINNFLEPLMYGSSAGITPLGVIMAALFWTWLWGPVGLILATPLTVCLIAVARHVPQLAFFDTLLAADLPQKPHLRFYQRLLQLDSNGARAVIENYFHGDHKEDIHKSILRPALNLVEQDYNAGNLDKCRRCLILEAMTSILTDLENRRTSNAEEDRENNDDTAWCSFLQDLEMIKQRAHQTCEEEPCDDQSRGLDENVI
ncbi:MAG: AI-2E family transporter [Pirellulales bacterium]|nr:AI-2E family transporter [Pirellulales bacterium]